MPEIMMPKEHRSIFAKLLTLSTEQGEALLREVSAVPLALPLAELAERVAVPVGLTPLEARAMIGMLSSMYEAMARESETPASFAALAVEAAREFPEDIRPKEVDWERAERLITELMKLHRSLGVSAKVSGVISDHDHVYCRSRILTDIRSVFTSSVSEPPAALAIVHTLRLTYHSSRNSGETEGFFIALDVKDLEEIRQQIDQAIETEKTLKSLFLSKELPVISASEVR